MQKSNIKNQNEKEKFKKSFIRRLIKFSLDIIKLSEEMRQKKYFIQL